MSTADAPRPRAARGLRRGWTMTTYLLAALLVPLAVAVINSVTQFRSAQRIQVTAQRLDDRIDRLTGMGRVYLPLVSEQVVFYGLVTLDGLGLDRAAISSQLGIDFAAYTVVARRAVDARLDALTAALAEDADELSATDAEQVARFREELARQRIALDQRNGSADDAEQLFEHFTRWLDARMAAIADQVGQAGDPIARTRAVIASVLGATEVRQSAAGEAVAAFNLVTLHPGSTAVAVVSAADKHIAALNAYVRSAGTAGPLSALQLDPAFRSWSESVDTLRQGAAAPVSGQRNPGLIAPFAALVTAHLGYLDRLDAAVTEAMSGQRATARQLAAHANRDRWLAVGVLALTLASVLAAIVALRVGVVRPLQRLSENGEALHDGHEPTGPLPLRGPREVRVATHTFNSLVGTFGTVRRAVSDLAAGRHVRDLEPAEDPPEQVPGPLGEALNTSVANLAALTEQLHHSQALAAAIVDHAADAIWTVDNDGLIQTANPAAANLVGVGAAEQQGQPIGTFLRRISGEVVAGAPGRKETPVLVSQGSSKVENVELRTIVAHDITERRELEVQLFHQARHDSLTGLANRAAALEHLNEMLAEPGERTAVMFIDIDGFKAVNDTNGHAVGDRVLTVVADRLRRRTKEGMAARLGGDEFLTVVAAADTLAQLRQVGVELIAEIERPIRLGDNAFSLSASVGIALSRPGERDAQQVVRRADEAAYLAKERGGGRVELYNAELQAMIERRSAVDLGIRQAVRSGEMELLFQPILDLRDGSFPVFEALVRWRRGDELVPAAAFIPIAERSSAILEIGRWALNEACSTLGRWQRELGLTERRLSINVSGRHLMDDEFVADVRSALERGGTSGSAIELELTETHLLTDLSRARHALRALAADGVAVAIDDFGAGFASMNYLRELKPEVVKLDREFIADVQANPTNQAIVAALVAIGDAIGFEVVAEGVETVEQLRYLARNGCRRAQGYLIAPPMSIGACEAWLAAGTPAAVDLALLSAARAAPGTSGTDTGAAALTE